jgi:hypothetical protein
VRIYVASTPYHLLLVGALQIGAGDNPAILMYDDEYRFIRNSGAIENAIPNVSVELLRSFDRSSRLQSVIRSRASANAILRQVRSASEGAELFLCCPTRRDVLRVAHCLKLSVPIHFVEDGLDAYLPHGITKAPKSGFLRKLGTRLVNGFPPPTEFDSAAVMKFEQFHMLFPEIRRDSIPYSRVSTIKAEWFVEATRRLQPMVEDFLPDASPTDIWFPSLSVQMADVSSYLTSLEGWIDTVQSSSSVSKCAVKCHPREQNTELLSGLDSLDVVRYPPWIPAELLMHKFDPHCKIRTGLSTFVLSSKILAPDRVIWLDSSVRPEYRDKLKRWDDAIRTVEQPNEPSTNVEVVSTRPDEV